MAGPGYFPIPNPDSTNNPVSHLQPDSNAPPAYSCDENPASGPRPVKKSGFIRSWLATSSSLRPTGDPTDIAWGIHWYTPVSIVLLLLLGTSTAVIHHLIYSSLHEQEVGNADRQRWTLSTGSGLSFLTKVTLTAALGISRTQWVWLTMRKKWLTLDSIDSLFGIISDPTLFLNWKMIRQAKVATVMAIAMWTFPLAAILTPGTISVQSTTRGGTFPCTVPSLLFGFDNSSKATIPTRDTNVTLLVDLWKWSEDYNQIIYSNLFIPAIRLTAYTGTIARLPSLDPSTAFGKQCGDDCSYSVQFLGPAMTCAQFTMWNKTRWANPKAFLNGNKTRAEWAEQNGSFILGLEGMNTKKSPRIVFECKTTTGNYTVLHAVREGEFLQPVITNFEKVNLPGFEAYPVVPNEAYMPTWGLYHTINQLIDVNGDRAIFNTVMMSDAYYNTSNIGNAIEQLAQRMIASMIGFNYILNGQKTVLPITATQETECETTKVFLVYIYSPQTLLIVYGLAIVCALATSIAGFIALGHNGMASTKAVSTIIRTSRNRTLDECIVGGDCLGGGVMSSELSKVELRFGALKTGKIGTAPFALGVKGEVYPIKRD
ncbi:hypothetical protein Q9L58_008917 [Maublancomyces gigas]|uniref:Uncharacterized protein n=1 Tax=Discina gigas TaxID=1032678 RepID=A0ABR3G8D1_9PEZI